MSWGFFQGPKISCTGGGGSRPPPPTHLIPRWGGLATPSRQGCRQPPTGRASRTALDRHHTWLSYSLPSHRQLPQAVPPPPPLPLWGLRNPLLSAYAANVLASSATQWAQLPGAALRPQRAANAPPFDSVPSTSDVRGTFMQGSPFSSSFPRFPLLFLSCPPRFFSIFFSVRATSDNMIVFLLWLRSRLDPVGRGLRVVWLIPIFNGPGLG